MQLTLAERKQNVFKMLNLFLIFFSVFGLLFSFPSMMNNCSCPVDDKLISRFRGSWSETDVHETQVYAYMKTFRFTGSPALYIECDVRMCHGRCPVSKKSKHIIYSPCAPLQSAKHLSHCVTIHVWISSNFICTH